MIISRSRRAAGLALSLAGLAAMAGAAPSRGFPDACACAADARCWSLAMTAYGEICRTALTEIEGSAPGRFFPRSQALALRKLDEGGHFLRVLPLGSSSGSGAAWREELERRLIAVSFLRALPGERGEAALFDPATWRVEAAGEDVLARAKKCRPSLWRELAGRLAAGFSEGERAPKGRG